MTGRNRAPGTVAFLAAMGAVLAITAVPSAAEDSLLVDIGPWGEDGPPLAEGQFEIRPLSTRASLVTNGDVLVGVLGLDAEDVILADVGGRDVTAAFDREADGRWVGLVEGLGLGDNLLTVTAFGGPAGSRQASLPLINHAMTGPIISGPHQEPFVCRTNDSGLGDPIDEDCSIEPRVEWYYKSTNDFLYHLLEDPFGPYPGDLATTSTTEGRTVPAVVRLETRTINRSITRIAVLDDPAARGPDGVFDPHELWNEKLLYHYGASCGIGRHQGSNQPGAVLSGVPDVGGSTPEAPDIQTGPIEFGLPTAVGLGYLAVHSTLTMFTNHCNPVLSAETVIMVKEHIVEQYGEPRFTFSTGASGGAIQQTTIADSYPGVIEAISPMVPFPDVATTAMSPLDCRLLNRVFETDGLTWNEITKQAVTGHATSNLCVDWDDFFADVVVADVGCGFIPEELRYDVDTNPDGERCTVQDQLVNILLPVTGTNRVELPYDNRGVQYGLTALNDLVIAPDDFIALNRDIGGYDVDGHPTAERTVMTERMARRIHDIGGVGGRGAINTVPMVQLNLYADYVPILDFHDQVRTYEMRERMIESFGTADSQVMWNGAHAPAEAWAALDLWLTAIDEGDRSLPRAQEVLAARPSSITDECGAVAQAPIGVATESGVCELILAPRFSPRMVAGGPLTEDIIKCQLRPLDPADYAHPAFTADHLAQLAAIFPDGVCDWSQPGVGGDIQVSRTWLSFGGDGELLTEPQPVANLVARSSSAGAATTGGSDLPATGGGVGLLALGLLLLARRLRTSG